MSQADTAFIHTCRTILDSGTLVTDEKVRPKWNDGTPAYTIKAFGVVNRYDLSKEFPLLTLRPIGLRSAIDEILWIWQKNPTTSMISAAIFGTAGPTKTALSAKPMAIKWASSINTKKACSTWWIAYCLI